MNECFCIRPILLGLPLLCHLEHAYHCTCSPCFDYIHPLSPSSNAASSMKPSLIPQLAGICSFKALVSPTLYGLYPDFMLFVLCIGLAERTF